MSAARIRAGIRGNAPELGLAAAGGLAAVAASFAAAGDPTAFVGAAVEAVIRDTAPEPVVEFVRSDLRDLAAPTLLATAVVAATALFALFGLAGVAVDRRTDSLGAGVAVAAVLGGGASTLLGVGPLPALAAAVPTALVPVTARATGAPTTVSKRRRTLLGSVGGLLGLAGASTVLGTQRGGSIDPEPLDEAAETETLLSTADERSLDLAGTGGLVSDSFYEVDYSNFDPTVRKDDWSLTVTGEVEEEVTVDFEGLRDMSTEHRFVTLRCVSDPLNGNKMDNALWTGTPLADLVEEAGPGGGCECVRLRAADDYYQVFPLAALRNGFLAYGMNGTELPKGHGHPVRVLIPGHWGEINVKWITEIEVLDRDAEGYWEERGWHGTGPVETVAKIGSVDERDDGTVRVGGHAYAGTRGVSAVEVSTDGGDTWSEATLSPTLPGDDVWRMWAHEFAADGTHEVVVRAVESDGTVQPREETDAYPSGATGWVSRTVEAER
ncbi:molybdopterin-dependent oxidoreductase [Halostella litorea]|uniref:molybdopterin-dependent oxidoreductase n=1 Tax=Halostella litorea TaxID=2528831 RepID=UPI001091C19A|nr:molybdopterin-dependent oxidoreductase [Halostella litorea]